MSDRKPHQRRHQRTEQPGAIRLVERDDAILRAVAAYHLLSQDQLERLFFGSRSAAQRVLARLYHHAYLDRRFLPVVAGRSPTLYVLDWRGLDRLRAAGDANFESYHLLKRVKSEFLAHTMAINDVRIAVTLGAKRHDCRLMRWISESALKADYDRVTIATTAGEWRAVSLIPDGYFTLVTPRGIANCFLELDRGTMTTARFKDKVRAYTAYYRSGGFEARYQAKAMRVLTVVTSPKRLANLKAATEAAGGQRPFWFALLTDVTPETILDQPVWQVATQTAKATLIEPI